MITLENHCTRTTQSSRGGCSRRVHKIVYLAVKWEYFGQYFTSENILCYKLMLTLDKMKKDSPLMYTKFEIRGGRTLKVI